MPARSLHTAVLHWPRRDDVLAAARRWAATVGAERDEVRRIGVIGSCARGAQAGGGGGGRNWGVGSDLDIVVVVDDGVLPNAGRCALWERPRYDVNLADVPVPVDVQVIGDAEAARWAREGRRMGHVLAVEAVWIWRRQPA